MVSFFLTFVVAIVLAGITWGLFLFVVSPWLMGPHAPRLALALHRTCSQIYSRSPLRTHPPTTRQIIVAASVVMAAPSVVHLPRSTAINVISDGNEQTGASVKTTMRLL